jgi:hypothetical protein
VKRRGTTLVEVTVAGALLIFVVIIVAGLVHTTDRAYSTELPLRERQVRCQGVVDGISGEILEGTLQAVWTLPIEGEPATEGIDAPEGLLFLSARDASGNFVTDGVTLVRIFQKAVAYLPLRRLDSSGQFTGEVELVRFDFAAGSLPDPWEGRVPRITATTSDVTLDWIGASPPVTRTLHRRTGGVCVLPNLVRFSVENTKRTLLPGFDPADPEFTPEACKIGVSARFPLGDGRFGTIKVDSSIHARN